MGFGIEVCWIVHSLPFFQLLFKLLRLFLTCKFYINPLCRIFLILFLHLGILIWRQYNAHTSFFIATIFTSHEVTANHTRHVGRPPITCGISGNVKRIWMVNVAFCIETHDKCQALSWRLQYHKTSQFTNDSSHYLGVHIICVVHYIIRNKTMFCVLTILY